MRNVIRQFVTLPATAEALYAMYLDAESHEAFTGGPVVIEAEAGAVFSAFGGTLTGTILALETSRLIVQSWRSAKFHDDDPDSTLILTFADEGEGQCRIDLVHIDVPDHDFDGVTEGWPKHYWEPWRKYLEK